MPSAWADPGLAFLRPFLDDPDVSDVFVNGEDGLFLDRGRGAERVPSWRASEAEVRRLAVRLIALGGRHLDDAAPCVDVRLERGVRVHAVLAPVAVRGTAISIRVPRWDAPDLEALDATGMFPRVSARSSRRWWMNARTSSSRERPGRAIPHGISDATAERSPQPGE